MSTITYLPDGLIAELDAYGTKNDRIDQALFARAFTSTYPVREGTMSEGVH